MVVKRIVARNFFYAVKREGLSQANKRFNLLSIIALLMERIKINYDLLNVNNVYLMSINGICVALELFKLNSPRKRKLDD